MLFLVFNLISTLTYKTHKGIKYREVALLNKDSAVKCSQQFGNFEHKVSEAFRSKDRFSVGRIYNYDRFLLLDKNNLIGYVEVSKKEVFYKNKLNWLFIPFKVLFKALGFQFKKYNLNVYAFYRVFIADEYKKKGFSKVLMDFTVQQLRKIDKSNFLLILHLNEEDNFMPVSTRLYYMLGFTKGRWCKWSAEDYLRNIRELTDNSDDIYDIIYGRKKGRGLGAYIGMYCWVNDYKRKKMMVDSSFYVKTEKFMEKMKARKRTYEAE